MRVQNPPVLVISSVHLQEVRTEVLDSSLVVVGAVAEGRDAARGLDHA